MAEHIESSTINTVKELRPALVYDVAATETWLEDIAQQGYHLTGFTSWCGVFEKGEPQEVRYRLQPMQQKEKRPDTEHIELYRELGWEYVTTEQNLFHVWRCNDPTVPELDTDPVVQAESWSYLVKRLRRKNMLDPLWALGLIAFCCWGVFVAGTPGEYLLYVVQKLAPGRWTLGTLALLMGLFLLLWDRRTRTRLLRNLSEGIPLSRPAPYRRQKWLARVFAGLAGCLCLLIVLGDGRAINGDSLGGGWDAKKRDGSIPADIIYVDLAQLEEAEEAPWIFSIETKIHELAPRMCHVRQLLEHPDDFRSVAETTYYRLLTADIAAVIAEELVKARPGSLGVSPHGELVPVETTELDGFWWVRSDVGVQYAVALLGKEVLEVQYEGPADLRQHAAYFAELLA